MHMKYTSSWEDHSQPQIPFDTAMTWAFSASNSYPLYAFIIRKMPYSTNDTRFNSVPMQATPLKDRYLLSGKI